MRDRSASKPSDLTALSPAKRVAARFRREDDALLDMSSVFVVLGAILGVVVTMLVIANLFPTFADATADVNTNLTDTNVTFGDATTDGIKPVFAIVVGLAALAGIVALILMPLGKLGS